MSGRAEDIERVALLADPTRRRLFEYVENRPHPVGRDEAAVAAGISRSLAAFHLDRLARAGLLEVEYRRLGGRTGRGAGRPAKLYRRTAAPVEVSLPENRYELAGRVLVRSIEDAAEAGLARDAVEQAAARRGRQLGHGLAERLGPERGLDRAELALEDLGFHPERVGAVLRPRNCPFHALVEESSEVVCSLNHALLGGLLEGLEESGLVAEPDPQPGACCVLVRARPSRSGV